MENLSQFKKGLTVGKMLNCTFHQKFNGRDSKGELIYQDEIKPPREISIVQTNSFALKTVKTSGEITDSWCAYPKASECVFKDNVLTIMQEDYRVREGEKPLIPVLSYSFVN